MKKLFVIFLLAALFHARADFVILETVNDEARGGHDDENLTIKVKGGKTRVEMGPAAPGYSTVGVIMDAATGDKIMLFHDGKRFVKVNAQLVKKMQDEMTTNEAANNDALATAKLTDTGKQEKVGDYNAEIYTAETPKRKITMWISKDLPANAALRDRMRKLQLTDIMPVSGQLPDISKIDGVPVKTEIITHENNGKTVQTVLAVKEAPVADADFLVPEGYKEGIDVGRPGN